MDVSETPDDIRTPEEESPDFSEWESPQSVVKGGPIRERLLDVIMQVREPTKVAVIAECADCDTETAREYLEWFASMGIVREHAGRPVRYERNESYLFWRRVEQIREEYSEDEIVEELTQTIEAIEAYQERFGTDSPGDVSLLEASRGGSVEDIWETVADWKTLEHRAKLLDAARQDEYVSGGRLGAVDA